MTGPDERTYDDTGVRATMMRGGTSRGLFVEASNLPADASVRDDLLLRLMGTPDPRQIDGLGGATSLTSKVAIVSRSAHPEADVDYLFLQLGVDAPTVCDRQTCGNLLAGVAPFALDRGLVPPQGDRTSVRIRMVNTDGLAVATVLTPGGRVEYRGDVEISGVPGRAAPVVLTVGAARPGGSDGRVLLPTGRVRDVVDGLAVTCVDAGMPVVLAMAGDVGLVGDESPQNLAADAGLLRRIDALRTAAGALMGLGDVSHTPIPKTALLSPPRHGGGVSTRSFIPVQPHAAVGMLAAVGVVAGMRLPGAVGHELTSGWPADRSTVDVEHPSGHLRVDVVVDEYAEPARLVRAGVVSTARKLVDGVAFPRAS